MKQQIFLTNQRGSWMKVPHLQERTSRGPNHEGDLVCLKQANQLSIRQKAGFNIFSNLGCRTWIFLVLFMSLEGLYAQEIPDLRGNSVVRGSGDGLPEKERSQEDFFEERDTFGVFSFYAENPNEEQAFSDSLLTNDFHQYDPTRKLVIDQFQLGTLGSATLPVLYQPTFRKGFELGLNQYDFYHIRAKKLPYRRLKSPYTNLTYTQVGEQSDTYFKGQFSRNFADGLNINLDYQSIAMVGTQNHFPNQNSRHTSIATGMWYHSKNEKYDAFISYAANTVEQQDNGGIILEPSEETPSSATTFLDDAQTRHAHRELLFTHYYKFGGEEDTITGQLKRAFTLNHQLGYLTSTYKFTDDFGIAATSLDSVFYHSFLTDFRGVRMYLEHQKLENTFNLSTYRLQNNTGNQAQSQKDLIEVGISHTLHSIGLEVSDSTLNNLFLQGKINFTPNNRLTINTYGHFGLLDNLGDYRLAGDLTLDFSKIGKLTVNFSNQLATPNLIQSRFYVTQREIWNLNLDKTLTTSLTGIYQNSVVDFVARGGYHLINNYIYFDSTGMVAQSKASINVLQLSISKGLRLGNFYLDNTIAIQEITSDVLPLPSLFGKHSLYYAGKWFQVLNVRLGFDIRYTTEYNAPYYHPLTGQFQVAPQFSSDIPDRRTIQFYPAADAYFSLRVTKFRAFVKWENLNQIFQNEQYYQIAYYPQWEGGLRIGINWRFTN